MKVYNLACLYNREVLTLYPQITNKTRTYEGGTMVSQTTLNNNIMLNIIGVGESGRGRQFSYLTVKGMRNERYLGLKKEWDESSIKPRDLQKQIEEIEHTNIVTYANVDVTKTGRTCLVKTETNETEGAIIIANLTGGFRGGLCYQFYNDFNEVVDYVKLEKKCEYNSENSIYNDEVKTLNDTYYVLKAKTRNIEEYKQIQVLAEGWTAEGDAGRMGQHRQMILKVTKPIIIRISRNGRVYGNERTHYFIVNDMFDVIHIAGDTAMLDYIDNI